MKYFAQTWRAMETDEFVLDFALTNPNHRRRAHHAAPRDQIAQFFVVQIGGEELDFAFKLRANLSNFTVLNRVGRVVARAKQYERAIFIRQNVAPVRAQKRRLRMPEFVVHDGFCGAKGSFTQTRVLG